MFWIEQPASNLILHIAFFKKDVRVTQWWTEGYSISAPLADHVHRLLTSFGVGMGGHSN